MCLFWNWFIILWLIFQFLIFIYVFIIILKWRKFKYTTIKCTCCFYLRHRRAIRRVVTATHEKLEAFFYCMKQYTQYSAKYILNKTYGSVQLCYLNKCVVVETKHLDNGTKLNCYSPARRPPSFTFSPNKPVFSCVSSFAARWRLLCSRWETTWCQGATIEPSKCGTWRTWGRP